MSLNSNDRFKKIDFKVFGLDSPRTNSTPSNVSKSFSYRKHKLYHDMNNSFCSKNVKKHKISELNTKVNNVVSSGEFNFNFNNGSTKSFVNDNNLKVNDWAIDDISSGCEDSPHKNTSPNTRIVKLDKLTTLETALSKSFGPSQIASTSPGVSTNSGDCEASPHRIKTSSKLDVLTLQKLASPKSFSSMFNEIPHTPGNCEDSPLRIKSSSKIDPVKLKKFASPITVPSTFKTLAPIKVAPLVRTNKSPGLTKIFVKQSVCSTTDCSNVNTQDVINKVSDENHKIIITQDEAYRESNDKVENNGLSNMNPCHSCTKDTENLSTGSLQSKLYKIVDDSPIKINDVSEFRNCSFDTGTIKRNAFQKYVDETSITDFCSEDNLEKNDDSDELSVVIQNDLTPVKSSEIHDRTAILDDSPVKDCDIKLPNKSNETLVSTSTVFRNIDKEETKTSVTPLDESYFSINDDSPVKNIHETRINYLPLKIVKEKRPKSYEFVANSQINYDDNCETPIKKHIVNINDFTPEKSDENLPFMKMSIFKKNNPNNNCALENEVNCDYNCETPTKKQTFNINDYTPKKMTDIVESDVLKDNAPFTCSLSFDREINCDYNYETPIKKPIVNIEDETPEKNVNDIFHMNAVMKNKFSNMSLIGNQQINQDNCITPDTSQCINIQYETPDKEMSSASNKSDKMPKEKTPVVRCFNKEFNEESNESQYDDVVSVKINDDTPEKQSGGCNFSFKTIDILRKNSSVLRFLACSDETVEDDQLNNASISKTKIGDWKSTFESFKKFSEKSKMILETPDPNNIVNNQKYFKKLKEKTCSLQNNDYDLKCSLPNLYHHSDKNVSITTDDKNLPASPIIKDAENIFHLSSKPDVKSDTTFVNNWNTKIQGNTPSVKKKESLSDSLLKSSVELSPIPSTWLKCADKTPVKEIQVNILDESPVKKKKEDSDTKVKKLPIISSSMNAELCNNATPVKGSEVNILDDTPEKIKLGLEHKVKSSPLINSWINDELSNDTTLVKGSEVNIQDDTPEKKITSGLEHQVKSSPIISSWINDELINGTTPIKESNINIEDETPEKMKAVSLKSCVKNSPVLSCRLDGELSNDVTSIKTSNIYMQDSPLEKKKSISLTSSVKNSPIFRDSVDYELSNDVTPVKGSCINTRGSLERKQYQMFISNSADSNTSLNSKLSKHLTLEKCINIQDETPENRVCETATLSMSRLITKKSHSIRNITSFLKDDLPSPINNENSNSCKKNFQEFSIYDDTPNGNYFMEVKELSPVKNQDKPFIFESEQFTIETGESGKSESIVNHNLDISNQSHDLNCIDMGVLIKDEQTPSNSQEIYINSNTCKTNEFNITEESTPTKEGDVHNVKQLSILNKDKLLLSSKGKQKILIAINDENSVLENNLEEDIVLKNDMEQPLAYNIDAFPSPSKDASVTMPCERESAVIAEIPGLTPRKNESSEDVVMLFSKRKKRLLLSNTLLSKAVAAVNNMKSSQKLFSYELQVGLRSIAFEFISDHLKILNMWKDHCSYYIQCRLLANYQNCDNINTNTIIFVLINKPKDVSVNDLLKVYYPMQMLRCKNQENILVGFAYHIEFIKNHCTESQVSNHDEYKPKILNIEHDNLSDVFKNKPLEYSYITLNSTKSQNITEAIFNCSLTNSVSLKVIILHSVISKSKAIFVVSDCEKSLCLFEFNNNNTHYKIENVLENTIYNFNNMKFIQKYNILENIQVRSIFEFSCCEIFNKDKCVYVLSPLHNWCSNQDFIEVKKIDDGFKFSSLSKIEDIDLKITKRYKIEIIIKKVCSNKLIVQSCESNQVYKIILNDFSFFHLFKEDIPFMIDGILCYKNQLIIDQFSSVSVV